MPVRQQAYRRKGSTHKVLKGNERAVPIYIPRDGLLGDASITCQAVDGSFKPELIHKGQTRIGGIKRGGSDNCPVNRFSVDQDHRALGSWPVHSRCPCPFGRGLRPTGMRRPCQPGHRSCLAEVQTGKTARWNRFIPLISLMSFGSKSVFRPLGKLRCNTLPGGGQPSGQIQSRICGLGRSPEGGAGSWVCGPQPTKG